MDDQAVATSGGGGDRTSGDVSVLLVELCRVARGCGFYPARDPALALLADRAYRAIRVDIDRSGPLELEVEPAGFRSPGLADPIAAPHLEELAQTLGAASIECLRITPEVTRSTFGEFAADLGEVRRGTGPAEPIASRPGIVLNGQPWVPPSRPASDPVGPGPDESSAVASLGAALLGRADGDVDIDAEQEKPPLDESPLEAPATSEGDAGLLHDLRMLDSMADDETYVALAARVAKTARDLAAQGATDESHRAVLVLADHAVGEGGRSAVQAGAAMTALYDLASGPRLQALVDRALSSDASQSVRAAQVLLLLGERAAPTLFDRLEAETDSDMASQLSGVLIALGERAAPAVATAIARGGDRGRFAIRLAGELQCPLLAQPLQELVCGRRGGESSDLQKDAARALVEMGNSAAVRALGKALESDNEKTASLAAYCLGMLGAPASLASLLDRLESATQRRKWRLAQEVVRSIGQFRRAEDPHIRTLQRWIERAGPPWRRPSVELKQAALDSLASLGGDNGMRAVRLVAKSSKVGPPLRAHAERILERRAKSDRAALRRGNDPDGSHPS